MTNIELLERFNQRASYLEDSTFLAWIKKRGNKQPNLERLFAGNWLVYEGLERESLDSFFLNLRPLLQGRDRYSVRQIFEIISSLPDPSNEVKSVGLQLQGQFQELMNRPTWLRLGDRSLTNQTLLETVLYGRFAHDDPKYIDDFDKLTKSGMFSLFSFISFINLVTQLTDHIRRLRMLNEYAIDVLSGAEKGA